jgi:hypothetical protein
MFVSRAAVLEGVGSDRREELIGRLVKLCNNRTVALQLMAVFDHAARDGSATVYDGPVHRLLLQIMADDRDFPAEGTVHAQVNDLYGCRLVHISSAGCKVVKTA